MKFPKLMLAAALGGLMGLAAPAMAQQAGYCAGGSLKANAFYSNVLSNGRTSDVEYHGQIQNQDPQRRSVRATVVQLQPWGRWSFVRIIGSFELGSYEQKDINLATVRVDNPSGQGAPSPQDMSQRLRIVCQYR